MTRAAVLDWLARRRPAPPDALRAHLAAAITDRAEALPDHLALEGAALLARVMAEPGSGRERALDLLAADAFVTYAFEAQAERDVGGLAALAARIDRAGVGAP
jgi:hypothetical protein